MLRVNKKNRLGELVRLDKKEGVYGLSKEDKRLREEVKLKVDRLISLKEILLR